MSFEPLANEQARAQELASDEGVPASIEKDQILQDLAPPEAFVPVRVLEVEMVLPRTTPVLILEEIEWPNRSLRIPIGLSEGTAIAYALSGIMTPKPLTHELFAEALKALGAQLETARITAAIGSAYYAEVVLSGPTGLLSLACRPSDAVALALRQQIAAPITVSEAVLAQESA